MKLELNLIDRLGRGGEEEEEPVASNHRCLSVWHWHQRRRKVTRESRRRRRRRSSSSSSSRGTRTRPEGGRKKKKCGKRKRSKVKLPLGFSIKFKLLSSVTSSAAFFCCASNPSRSSRIRSAWIGFGLVFAWVSLWRHFCDVIFKSGSSWLAPSRWLIRPNSLIKLDWNNERNELTNPFKNSFQSSKLKHSTNHHH